MNFTQDINAQKAVILAVLAWAIMAAMFPSKAHAQSLGDIVTDIAEVTGVVPRHCRYGSAVIQANCYVGHVERTSQQRQYQRERRASETTQRMQQQMRRADALQRACDLGDQTSCISAGRVRGQTSERQYELARALLEACRAGDRASCARLGG